MSSVSLYFGTIEGLSELKTFKGVGKSGDQLLFLDNCSELNRLCTVTHLDMISDFLRTRKREITIVDTEGFVEPCDFSLNERLGNEAIC